MSQAAIHMLKRRWGLPDAAAPLLERFFSSWAAGHTSLELTEEEVDLLAGSAAVMLLILPRVSSFWVGIGYLVLFGVGTMLSMAAVTLLLGIPFAVTGGFNRLSQVVSGVAGGASVLFGVGLMSDIALGTSLIPF